MDMEGVFCHRCTLWGIFVDFIDLISLKIRGSNWWIFRSENRINPHIYVNHSLQCLVNYSILAPTCLGGGDCLSHPCRTSSTRILVSHSAFLRFYISFRKLSHNSHARDKRTFHKGNFCAFAAHHHLDNLYEWLGIVDFISYPF